MKPVLVLLLLCLFVSCRCGKKEVYYFTTTARDYFVDFGEGSYWVYQNEADSNDVDTLQLLNKKTGMDYVYTEQECDGNDFEYAHYDLVSARTGDTLAARHSARVTSDALNLTGRYHSLQFYSHILANKDDRSFSVNTYLDDSLGTYASYSLGGKTYTDVMSMSFRQYNRSFPERATTYVYARHVGLIAFSIYDASTSAMRSYFLKEHCIVK